MLPLDWIKNVRKTTPRKLAQEWRVAYTTIWRPATGRASPSFALVVKFHRESGGKVTLADWLELRAPPALSEAPKRKGKT